MRLLSAIFCFALLVCAWPAAAATPKDCLNEISQAMQDGDAVEFEKLVDLNPILEASLQKFLEEAAKPENAASLPPMLALLFTQKTGQAGEAVKGMLLAAARAFVINGVSSGAFAGKQLDQGQSQSLLTPLFAHASIGRKEIRDIGDAMPADGCWLASFTVHDYGNGRDYPVIGRFSEDDNGMRLVGIENLDQIFHQIRKEAAGD